MHTQFLNTGVTSCMCECSDGCWWSLRVTRILHWRVLVVIRNENHINDTRVYALHTEFVHYPVNNVFISFTADYVHTNTLPPTHPSCMYVRMYAWYEWLCSCALCIELDGLISCARERFANLLIQIKILIPLLEFTSFDKNTHSICQSMEVIT